MEAPRRLDAAQFHEAGLKATHRLSVFFNGDAIFHVISYDCDEGLVTRLVTDSNGNLMTNGQEVVSETLHGDVRVSLKELQRA